MNTTLKCCVFLLCIALFDAKTKDHKEFRCDYTYFDGDKEAEGWYKLHKIPMRWQDARLRCHLEGAILASPINTGIGVVMMKLKQKISNTTVIGPETPISVYTGFHATYSLKDYASIEGIPLSQVQHKWASGSPFKDLVGDVDCLIMEPDGSLSGVEGHLTELPFICYKPYEKLRINECGTVDNNYVLDNRTGHCYKFHSTAREWHEAYTACVAEGAHLVVVNSKDEANIIMDMLSENRISSHGSRKHRKLNYPAHWDSDKVDSVESGEPDDSAEQGASESIVHVGYTHAKWLPMTIHGQTLFDAGYSKMHKRQRGQDGMCGAMDDRGYLKRVICDVKWHRFVCEKSPHRMTCA